MSRGNGVKPATRTARIRKAAASPRLRRKLSLTRQLGLRHIDRGATVTEYAGVLVLVALIVAAVFGTSINETVASTVGTKVCEITGGDGCGGGDGDGGQNQADGPKGDGGDPGKPDVAPDDSGKDQPAGDNGGENGGDENLSADEIAYNDKKKELDKALKDYNVTKEDLKKAAEELIKIAGEETGITDALKCITEGDGSACTETVINALLMAAGGMPLKLAKKYLLNPKKAWEVGKSVVKNGTKVAKGLKGLYSQSKKIKKLKKETADLKKKADAAKKKRTACPTNHSFLPGTAVALADGRRVPIEQVRLGDRVLATEPTTGRTAARRVTDTITTLDDKDFTRLTVLTGSGTASLTATDTHPFWLTGRSEWAEAGTLTVGDGLRTPSGDTVRVAHVERYEQQQRTHDLSVEGIHSYYVGIGASSVLVHNVGCGPHDVDPSVRGPAAAAKQLKGPNKRHTVAGAKHGMGKERNSIIKKGYEDKVDADVKAIADGKAKLVDSDTYEINGRRYGVHDGTAYPKSGDGIVEMDSHEYAALKEIAKAGGKTDSPALQRNPRFANHPERVEKAKKVYDGTY